MKQRTYSFHSLWKIQASRSKVWKELTVPPFSWDAWWPQLIDLDEVRTKPEHVGTTFNCTWRAASGYKLRTRFTIVRYSSPLCIVFKSTGDLYGISTWKFSEQAGWTYINIDWKVQTTKVWMNLFYPILKPVFAYNHEALMNSGARGLQFYMLA